LGDKTFDGNDNLLLSHSAFPLTKFFKESLMHGPLNLWVNDKL